MASRVYEQASTHVRLCHEAIRVRGRMRADRAVVRRLPRARDPEFSIFLCGEVGSSVIGWLPGGYI